MAFFQFGADRDIVALGTADVGSAPVSETISSMSAAKSLTPPRRAKGAFIQVLTQGVRMRFDGTDPTASVGVPFAAGDIVVIYGDLGSLRFIEQTASATMLVQYVG